VRVDAVGAKQIQEVRSGGRYASQDDLRLYFGLASYPGKVDVTVTLPGGAVHRWRALEADRLAQLRLDVTPAR